MGWAWFFSSASGSEASQPPAARPTPPSSTRLGDSQQASMVRDERANLLLDQQNKQRLIEARPPAEVLPVAGDPIVSAPHRGPLEPQRAPQEQFRRSAKQLGLFFAGAGFLTATIFISRRAVQRKMVTSYPKLFQPSHHGPRPPPRGQQDKGDDTLVAAEALGLATMNVFSFGIMMTGGLMWAFDISSVEDLRRKARSKLYGANGVVDQAAEQQMEEWIADVLSRRDNTDIQPRSQKKD